MQSYCAKCFTVLSEPNNKPSSASQSINKATAARSTLEKIISSYANFSYCLNFLSILTDIPINLNFVSARSEFNISRLNVCVSSQNLQFFIITFLVVLRTNTNKCTKELKQACT